MAWLFTAASLLLGIGVVSANLDVGTWLVIAATALVGAALFARQPLERVFVTRSVVMILVVGAVLGAVILTVFPAIGDVRYALGVAAVGAIGLHALVFETRWRSLELGVVVGGHFALLAWMLVAAGPPAIDVHQFQQEAAAALLHGTNPYGLRYENLSGPGSPYYSPEVEDGNFLTFGFVYPPLSLIFALPGFVLAGDYRFGSLAAVSLSALAIAFVRPGTICIGAALLILFSPVTPRIVYWGWTEPFVGLLLAATVMAAIGAPRATPWAMGLLIAAKQYVAPFYLIGVVTLDRVRKRNGLPRMALLPPLIASLTAVPFLVWDPSSFIYSTVTVHNLQPFRADSLSVGALLARAGFTPPPAWVGFLIAALALLLVLLRAPRTVSGFCGGSMLVLLVFFLFGKQAHMNYYFLIIVGLACALVAAMAETSSNESSSAAT